MKKRLIIFLTIILACSMIFAVSCKKKATEEDYSNIQPVPEDANIDPETGINLLPEGNGIVYEEEAEGAELTFRKEDPSMFYGEWVATSDQSAHLYGNVDLMVNENHTWTGNITDEELSGKWKETKTGIKIEYDTFSLYLDFDGNGTLIMTEKGQNGASDFHTVLKRKTEDGEE